MSAGILRDLARAKVTFQLRAIETVIRGPVSRVVTFRTPNVRCCPLPDYRALVPASDSGGSPKGRDAEGGSTGTATARAGTASPTPNPNRSPHND